MSRWEAKIAPVAAVAAVLLAGCPRDSDTTPAKKTATMVRVRSFTEATQVTSVTAVLPYGFTATVRGLDRWDLRTGQRLLLTADHGLPGDRVMATALDAGRGWLWLATDGGLTRYEIESGVFTGVPPAPTDALASLASDVRALSPAGTGGVWIGGPAGLAYADSAGDWKHVGLNQPVAALHRDKQGNLWIGTDGHGVFVRKLDGTIETYGNKHHQMVRTVRFITEGPDGAPVIVGETDDGKQRIAIYRNGIFASFRASPDHRWLAATRRGEEVVIMTKRKLYAMGTAHKGARRLRRDGMRLVPLASGSDTERSRSPYVISEVDAKVPTGAHSIATAGEELLIGTNDLGTAVMKPGSKRVHWLRRGELGGGGENISVACVDRDDCFVATGGRGVWHFDGGTFGPIGDPEAVVLAVARSAGGEVFALFRMGDEAKVRFARIDSGAWTELEEIQIQTPGHRAGLSFAKFSPRGMLWVGLVYQDETNQELSYGVAEIDTSLALIAYHHASHDEDDADKGVLPIPISVTDVAFLGEQEVWLASQEGAVRIQGQTMRVFMESEGLVSELLRSIAVTSGGVVFAATGVGVAVFDGEKWSAPAPLQRAVNAVAVGPKGKLWMATPRGVASYDGARVRRLDSRRGLLEDDIADIVIDRFGRIWALSESGISIVIP